MSTIEPGHPDYDPRLTIRGQRIHPASDVRWDDPRWKTVEDGMRADLGAHPWWVIRRAVEEALKAGLVEPAA